jgi:DNA-3-methyladenine glycosylase
MSDFPPIRRLRRAQLPIDTTALARFLIGKCVVRELPGGRVAGRIVETEAYVIGDAASHAFAGQTARNRTLFLHRGHAYIYLAYGISWLLNVSSEPNGIGAGVLIRALEPIQGVALMQKFRGTSQLRDLTRGPGRLAQALQIDRGLDGTDLCAAGPLWLGTLGSMRVAIGTSVRIGISRDIDRPLRFYARGNCFVSGPKKLQQD